MAVLVGYAGSFERTLETFYERVQPFAKAFMALFGRDREPSRSTLSRFLAALDQAPVEALRALFFEDLVARPLEKKEQAGGLWDRRGTRSVVCDIDGTRQAARQRALPCTSDLPAAARRLQEVCAPGYTGRKRGEVVRTRTAILQAHTRKSARHVLRKLRGRQRRKPRRPAPGGQGDQRLCESTSCSTEPGRDALGWTIWQWSDCGRSGWTGLHHARQGL